MKITKYIPNTITSMNLLSGVIGVIFAFKGRFDLAFYAMLAGAVFDFCDGLAARCLGAYSDIGKELDSLCDMVTFGVLPSVMLYNLMKMCTFSSAFWCMVPLLIALFSALRLAKFNVDPRQGDTFIGLATPACAILCGSLSLFIASHPSSILAVWACGYVFIPVLSVVLSILLVSELPMFSMKFKKGDSQVLVRKRISFFINCGIVLAAVIIAGLHWSLGAAAIITLYILMNVVFAIVKL